MTRYKVEKELKRRAFEKQIQKFFSEVMRAVGFVFLFAFSVIGAFFFYFIRYGDVIQSLFVSSIVVLMMFALTQVKDKWV